VVDADVDVEAHEGGDRSSAYVWKSRLNDAYWEESQPKRGW